MDNQFVKKRRKKVNHSGFTTPEQMAVKDSVSTDEPKVAKADFEITSPLRKVDLEKEKKKRRFSFTRPSKKTTLIMGCSLVILVALGLVGYKYLHKNALNIQTSKINALYKPVSNTVPSNLSGLPVDPNLNKIPVTAVMIENSIDARPQSGLSAAMVVFEAVAEGGVTRFMGLFQDTSPSSVGPIRSARPYYVAWSMGFDAGYAHVGGSPDALSDIAAWNVRDLNQFYNGSYYTRVTTRQAPHNVYTSISELNQLEDKKGYTSSTFTSWTRKTAAPLKMPTETNISMNLSGPVYNPAYAYNSSLNCYQRSEGGAPQIDANNNQQICPKVVIAIVVPETQGALDASGAYYSDYNFVGTNTAYVFQDGGLTQGSWTKSSNSSQILFTTSNNKPLALDPGQVWVTAITGSSELTYN